MSSKAGCQVPSWVPRWLLRNKRVKYVCRGDIGWRHPHYCSAESFESERAAMRDCVLIMKRGYAWDGCSYKFVLFNFITVGTPDGIPLFCPNRLKYISAEHDANVQFAQLTGLTAEQIDEIFLQRMVAVSWPFAGLYYRAVRKVSKLRGEYSAR